MTITQQQLHLLLDYDPATGVFRWKAKAAKNTVIGSIAGCYTEADGYTRLRINKVLYLAHRLAWFYVYGQWPTNKLDHRNRLRSDNWIANLREASDEDNSRNQNCRRDSNSGKRGVTWNKAKNKWEAYIWVNAKRIYLGLFSDISLASKARASAEIKYFGEFAALLDAA